MNIDEMINNLNLNLENQILDMQSKLDSQICQFNSKYGSSAESDTSSQHHHVKITIFGRCDSYRIYPLSTNQYALAEEEGGAWDFEYIEENLGGYTELSFFRQSVPINIKVEQDGEVVFKGEYCPTIYAIDPIKMRFLTDKFPQMKDMFLHCLDVELYNQADGDQEKMEQIDGSMGCTWENIQTMDIKEKLEETDKILSQYFCGDGRISSYTYEMDLDHEFDIHKLHLFRAWNYEDNFEIEAEPCYLDSIVCYDHQLIYGYYDEINTSSILTSIGEYYIGDCFCINKELSYIGVLE